MNVPLEQDPTPTRDKHTRMTNMVAEGNLSGSDCRKGSRVPHMESTRYTKPIKEETKWAGLGWVGLLPVFGACFIACLLACLWDRRPNQQITASALQAQHEPICRNKPIQSDPRSLHSQRGIPTDMASVLILPIPMMGHHVGCDRANPNDGSWHQSWSCQSK